MSNDPSYIAARELDTTLAKLRNDLCECTAKVKCADEAAKKKKPAPDATLQIFGLVLLAFAAFWLLSHCGSHR